MVFFSSVLLSILSVILYFLPSDYEKRKMLCCSDFPEKKIIRYEKKQDFQFNCRLSWISWQHQIAWNTLQIIRENKLIWKFIVILIILFPTWKTFHFNNIVNRVTKIRLNVNEVLTVFDSLGDVMAHWIFSVWAKLLNSGYSYLLYWKVRLLL